MKTEVEPIFSRTTNFYAVIVDVYRTNFHASVFRVRRLVSYLISSELGVAEGGSFQRYTRSTIEKITVIPKAI